MGTVHRIFKGLSEWAFPSFCLECSELLDGHESGLCTHCMQTLEPYPGSARKIWLQGCQIHVMQLFVSNRLKAHFLKKKQQVQKELNALIRAQSAVYHEPLLWIHGKKFQRDFPKASSILGLSIAQDLRLVQRILSKQKKAQLKWLSFFS